MTTKPKGQKSALVVPQPDPDEFAEIVALIATSEQNAYRAVNTLLIDLYWQVGEYVSRKIEAAEWGSGTGREPGPVHRPYASGVARLLPTQPIQNEAVLRGI